MRRLQVGRGFTLVELLVVIGIIALLISILLPSLNAARRQAKAVKCLSQLREIGNCFQMYAVESRGWYPPSQLRMQTGEQYSLPQLTVDGREIIVKQSDGYGVYWFNFLNKYASRSTSGIYNNGNKQEADQVRYNSILWGCPDWEGFANVTYGYNRIQPGYGMNGYPTFNDNVPTAASGLAYPPVADWSYNADANTQLSNPDLKWSTTQNQTIAFRRQTVWGKRGAERCLIADSRFWLADSDQVPSTGIIPPPMRDLNVGNVVAGQTSVSPYRHGKVPGTYGTSQFQLTGGKFGFNILYADGHSATSNDIKDAYSTLRMKFPG